MNLTIQKTIEAAETLIECQRVLSNTDSNIVSDLLRFSENFVEWNHYPDGDVKDKISGGQYYYHAHPTNNRDFNEHGHFHIFLKNKKDDACKLPLTHIIAISMDAFGAPKALFTVNHWVTGGVWENAETVISFLDKFIIDHAQPSWPANKWINSMMQLFREEIILLIKERDVYINKQQKDFPDKDILEDRDIEITSYLPISIIEKLIKIQSQET